MERVSYEDINLAYQDLEKIEVVFDKVFGDFNISRNKLVDLSGTPKMVIGTFDCSGNQLKSLKNGPAVVGIFKSFNNPDLADLSYAPMVVNPDPDQVIRNTKISRSDFEAYVFMLQAECWNPGESFYGNLENTCKLHPDIFQHPWECLDRFRDQFRGFVEGRRLGIF